VDVEVVYTNGHRQVVLQLDVPEGARLGQVLDLVGQDPRLCEVDLAAHAVGVYGEVCGRERVLAPGDRVEVYRELLMDAKTARRKRAMQQKQDI
jgi:putative ubiquitin-RnfH superfamily antitoxin RatB of RatAB toxin-antitoxin module